MFSRLSPFAKIIETGAIGLFFVQALRTLIAQSYSGIASASLLTSYAADSIPADTPGIVSPEAMSNAIIILGLVAALPVLALLLGRLRIALVGAALLTVGGRLLMSLPDAPVYPLIAAEITVGGALLYIALLIAQRARLFPYFFLLGFAGDQLLRAFGDTTDPSLMSEYAVVTTVGCVLTAAISVFTYVRSRNEKSDDTDTIDKDNGLLTIWGAVGLGGLLFLELSLLSLPNAITAYTDASYASFVPILLGATLLPLVPLVRKQARQLLAPFDSNTRGWIWLIFIALLIVIGMRLPQLPIPSVGNFPLGAITLTIAQFAVSMLWWWLVRPKAEDERNFGGLWLIVSIFILTLLIIGNIFTYEYAFVRDFAPPLDALNPLVPSLLRGFRGLGLGLMLVAAFLGALPMIQATRRIPWVGGTTRELVVSLLTVIGGSAIAAYAALPPQVQAVRNVAELRIGTYNIHAGYSEFYDYSLDDIADTIQRSGAEIVLLQEVEAGRLTSYGVDQALWLARRLGMDRRYYPTNEGLRGLAVLSRVPIVFDDGSLLPSIDEQTGLQRVQVQPDDGAITIYNTSLGLLLQGENLSEQEQNQRQQLNAILSIIDTHRREDYGGSLGRALLGGTFHNVPDSPLIQTLDQTGFVDPFAGSNVELTSTLNRLNLPPARYDYIWLWGQALQSVGNGVIPSDASDHRMAFVGVRIRSGE